MKIKDIDRFTREYGKVKYVRVYFENLEDKGEKLTIRAKGATGLRRVYEESFLLDGDETKYFWDGDLSTCLESRKKIKWIKDRVATLKERSPSGEIELIGKPELEDGEAITVEKGLIER